MVTPGTTRDELNRVQRIAFALGGVAALAAGVGAAIDLQQFQRSYLLAFLLWLSLPLGSLALVMLHRLTGGSWGFAIRRLLEAATRTLPLMALLFLPIALSVHALFEWSHADVVAADAILQKKAPYLNVPFWLGRAALYFVLWTLLATLQNRISARLDREPGEALERRARGLAGVGIGVYVLTMSFAAVDWAMSLEPHWFSTLYGLMFVVGHGLSTFAFVIVVAAWLARREPFSRWITADHFHDLGKLLFAFVMLWAYLAYSQYLIIWSGNLAEETPWYLHRSGNGWQTIALTLVFLHFFLPFALLLLRKTKRTPRLLAGVAAGLFVMRLVDMGWLIVPAFHPGGLHLAWMDLALPVAMGGLWVGMFISQLKGRPLISLQDAGLTGELELGAPAGAAGGGS